MFRLLSAQVVFVHSVNLLFEHILSLLIVLLLVKLQYFEKQIQHVSWSVTENDDELQEAQYIHQHLLFCPSHDSHGETHTVDPPSLSCKTICS